MFVNEKNAQTCVTMNIITCGGLQYWDRLKLTPQLTPTNYAPVKNVDLKSRGGGVKKLWDVIS